MTMDTRQALEEIVEYWTDQARETRKEAASGEQWYVGFVHAIDIIVREIQMVLENMSTNG